MQSYQEKKRTCLNLFSAVIKVARANAKELIASELEKEAAHLESGELNTVVCGEAKRGKSSLIDAFLEEQDICPVDSPVATNCATVIRFAEKEKIVVHFEIVNESDGKGEMRSAEISRAEIADFVTEKGNRSNRRRVKLVEVSLNNPKLAAGLVLIDTPGVGSMNRDHTAVTYQTIPYSDAVVFTGSATEPLNDFEADFAAERVYKHTTRMMYVLTKRDLVDNWEERLVDDLEMLEARLGVQPGTIHGVAISSKHKMQHAKNGMPAMLEKSGFSRFEESLDLLLSLREEILLGRAQHKLLDAISQLKLPIEAEKAGLEAESIQTLETLEQNLKAKIDRATELSGASASWNADLQTDIRTLQNDAVTLLSKQFKDLRYSVNDYLQIPEYIEDPEKLGAMLSVDCNSSFAKVVQMVGTRVGEIVTRLVDNTSLQIDEGRATIHADTAIKTGQVLKKPERALLERTAKAFSASRMDALGLGSAGGIGGAMIGGILGAFGGPVGVVVGAKLGGAAGAALGGLLGGIFGIKRGFKEQKERDITALRLNLAAESNRQLDDAHLTLQNQLQNLITALGNDIHKDLLRKIQAEVDACKTAVAALERARRERQADFSARLRELANALKHLEYLEEAALGLSMKGEPARTAA